MTRRGPNGRSPALTLVALSTIGLGCATAPSHVPRPLDGVYAFTAHRGGGSFGGTLSLASTADGYQGYFATSSLDLPLVGASVDGPRATLTFDDERVMYVLTVILIDDGLRGSWRTLGGGGSIQATLVSTAWHREESNGRSRVTQSPGPTESLPPRPTPRAPHFPGMTGDSRAPASR